MVKRVQGVPVCFAQGIANSETVCSIFTEQKPNDREAQSKLFATGVMSNAFAIDLQKINIEVNVDRQ